MSMAGRSSARAVFFSQRTAHVDLWRREVMEKGGGVRALGAEIAEDAVSARLP
jgi:hypothetical protein